MTSRATITEAELHRAVKVAQASGLVVRVTRGGAYLVKPEDVPPDLTPVDETPRPEQAEKW